MSRSLLSSVFVEGGGGDGAYCGGGAGGERRERGGRGGIGRMGERGGERASFWGRRGREEGD